MKTKPTNAFAQGDWNVYAACYDALLELRPYQELLEQVKTRLHLQPQDVLLDVGSGTGNLLNLLGRQPASATLTGIDSSPEMIKRAQEKCSGQKTLLTQANANAPFPFSDHTFSKIVSVNALYALADPRATLREIYRVLSPGGELVLVTPRQGFDNGLVLKEHANDSGPDSFWKDPHSSAVREERIIRAAIRDELLIEQMQYVAHQNRRIAQTTTFHFFSPISLRRLLLACAFSVKSVSLTYAQQGILIHAKKEV